MTTTSIKRMSTSGLDIADARVALAEKAHAKLGYKRLALAIAIPGALLFQLRTLGIEPFTHQSVSKYMTSKEHKGMYSGTKLVIFVLCMFIMCTSAFIAGMTNINAPTWPAWRYALNTATGLTAIVFGFLLIGALVEQDWEAGHRTVTKWVSTSIQHYTGNVPEFALARAVQIKEALPAAIISVHYLVEETERVAKPLPDPFLHVSLGDEGYFIDVWDEKEYESKLY